MTVSIPLELLDLLLGRCEELIDAGVDDLRPLITAIDGIADLIREDA